MTRRSIHVRFVPRDLWIGVYVGPWERSVERAGDYRKRSVYVCLVPCLPIVITRYEA